MVLWIGAGKSICNRQGYHSYKCLLGKRGMTEDQYAALFQDR